MKPDDLSGDMTCINSEARQQTKECLNGRGTNNRGTLDELSFSHIFDYNAIEQIANGLEKMVQSWSDAQEERAQEYARISVSKEDSPVPDNAGSLNLISKEDCADGEGTANLGSVKKFSALLGKTSLRATGNVDNSASHVTTRALTDRKPPTQPQQKEFIKGGANMTRRYFPQVAGRPFHRLYSPTEKENNNVLDSSSKKSSMEKENNRASPKRSRHLNREPGKSPERRTEANMKRGLGNKNELSPRRSPSQFKNSENSLGTSDEVSPRRRRLQFQYGEGSQGNKDEDSPRRRALQFQNRERTPGNTSELSPKRRPVQFQSREASPGNNDVSSKKGSSQLQNKETSPGIKADPLLHFQSREASPKRDIFRNSSSRTYAAGPDIFGSSYSAGFIQEQRPVSGFGTTSEVAKQINSGRFGIGPGDGDVREQVSTPERKSHCCEFQTAKSFGVDSQATTTLPCSTVTTNGYFDSDNVEMQKVYIDVVTSLERTLSQKLCSTINGSGAEVRSRIPTQSDRTNVKGQRYSSQEPLLQTDAENPPKEREISFYKEIDNEPDNSQSDMLSRIQKDFAVAAACLEKKAIVGSAEESSTRESTELQISQEIVPLETKGHESTTGKNFNCQENGGACFLYSVEDVSDLRQGFNGIPAASASANKNYEKAEADDTSINSSSYWQLEPDFNGGGGGELCEKHRQEKHSYVTDAMYERADFTTSCETRPLKRKKEMLEVFKGFDIAASDDDVPCDISFLLDTDQPSITETVIYAGNCYNCMKNGQSAAYAGDPIEQDSDDSKEAYKTKVEELQIALLECAAEYEVKVCAAGYVISENGVMFPLVAIDGRNGNEDAAAEVKIPTV